MAALDSQTCDFGNPPVVETVVGVQFASLPGFTSGHFGWFWKNYLGPEWEKATDAPIVPEQVERFGEQRSWMPSGTQMVALSSHHPDRVQITTAAEDRLIQVQATRFIYNWRKKQGSYPKYATIRPEFDRYYGDFCRFTVDAGLGSPKGNQWEVSYVNQMCKGTVWHTPAEWHKILPSNLGATRSLGDAHFESVGGEWHYEIAPQKGRLHVALSHGRVGSPAGEETLTMQLTARGPIRDEAGWDLDAGLNLGHKTIVRAFVEMTSTEAQKFWERTAKP